MSGATAATLIDLPDRIRQIAEEHPDRPAVVTVGVGARAVACMPKQTSHEGQAAAAGTAPA